MREETRARSDCGGPSSELPVHPCACIEEKSRSGRHVLHSVPTPPRVRLRNTYGFCVHFNTLFPVGHGRTFFDLWSGRPDLNRGPPAPKVNAETLSSWFV